MDNVYYNEAKEFNDGEEVEKFGEDDTYVFFDRVNGGDGFIYVDKKNHKVDICQPMLDDEVSRAFREIMKKRDYFEEEEEGE